MKNRFSKILAISTGAALMVLYHPVFAQVVNTAAQSAGDKADLTLRSLLNILTGVAVTLCIGAITILGYKAWYEPNFKLSDGKNIVIGGVLVGMAAALAQFFKP